MGLQGEGVSISVDKEDERRIKVLSRDLREHIVVVGSS